MIMVGHMTNYWRNHPPVHVLVAGYMNFKPAEEVTCTNDLYSNLAAIAADVRDELPEHLRNALDTFSLAQ
jgi:hypothetical protein